MEQEPDTSQGHPWWRRLVLKPRLMLSLVLVLVPLAVLGRIQYVSLLRLEIASVAQMQQRLDAFLTTLNQRLGEHLEATYGSAVSLTVSELLEGTRDRLRRVHPSVRLAFVRSFGPAPEADELEVEPVTIAFRPADGSWFEVLPPALDDEVRAACFPFVLKWEAGERWTGSDCVAHVRPPDSRVLLHPVLDDRQAILGVAGVLLDESYLREEVLPEVEAEVLAAEYSADERKGLALRWETATQASSLDGGLDGAPEEGERSISLTGLLRGWQLSIRHREGWRENEVRCYFLATLAVTACLVVLLLGGVVFTLRAAEQETRLARARSDLVSNVSHELRTPVSALRMLGEFLRRGRIQDADQVRDYGRRIEQESLRLSRLIDRVLDFSRLESGKNKLNLKPGDVRGLVQETLDEHRRLTPEAGCIELDDRLGDRSTAVMDVEAIGQALHNLLDNAAKYAPGRPVCVSMGRNNGEVVLAVRDAGPGIPPVDQERVFEKFFRRESGLVHDVKGAGLGLSIVRQVAEAHGGQITVESNAGDGSTFRLRWPDEAGTP